MAAPVDSVNAPICINARHIAGALNADPMAWNVHARKADGTPTQYSALDLAEALGLSCMLMHQYVEIVKITSWVGQYVIEADTIKTLFGEITPARQTDAGLGTTVIRC